MIIGLGSDLCDIRRIQKTIDRFGDRFVDRVFTATEAERARRKPGAAATLAKRFAAKEACAKALGTGMSRGVFWRDIGVINAASGAPSLALTRGAAARLASLAPAGSSTRLHLSLTDDFPYALAFVVIEAEPAPIATEAERAERAIRRR